MNIFTKSPLLAWFGLSMLLLFFILLCLSFIDKRELLGVSVWLKPMKFSLAVWIYCWTLAFILPFLQSLEKANLVTLVIISTMIIEMVLIVFQASRGVMSHFNTSSLVNGLIFSTMGFVITINTIAVVFIAAWFFTDPVSLPAPLIWGVRLGLIMFVIFSLEGFVMGSLNKHAVGAEDGGKGLKFFNWSVNAGDLRVAHFIGIHALQIVPCAAFLFSYMLNFTEKNATIFTLGFSGLYFAISALAFVRAMMGKPLLF